VVHLVLNRFGHAFGTLAGHHEFPAVPIEWKFTAVKYPVYTGSALISSGRWIRLGNYSDVPLLFPEEPEIFHSRSPNRPDTRIGPYGSGETAAGALRDLEERESRDLDLNNKYRQIMLDEQFEAYVQELLGRKRVS